MSVVRYESSMGEQRSGREIVAEAVKDLRRTIGWTQGELAARAEVSQSWVSLVEGGHAKDVTFLAAERLLAALGARLVVTVTQPHLGDRARQRDPAHARCAAYVAARLRRHGFLVETEVEVGGVRSRGWIDILAFHPETGELLVIEIKTEIHDLGAIQRSLGWYEREAWEAAARLGWTARAATGVLLLLATEANDIRARVNREALGEAFPIRSKQLYGLISGSDEISGRRRVVAMVDPRSHRVEWIRPLRIDGRRSPAPYDDYADFMRRIG